LCLAVERSRPLFDPGVHRESLGHDAVVEWAGLLLRRHRRNTSRHTTITGERYPAKNSRRRQQWPKQDRAITAPVGRYTFSTTPSGGTYARTLTVTSHAESNDLETQRLDTIAALERYIASRKGQIWTWA